MKKILIASLFMVAFGVNAELMYKGGSGLVYKPNVSQCGKNCDQYAKEDAEYNAQREATKQERIEWARERDAAEDAKEKRSGRWYRCNDLFDAKVATIKAGRYQGRDIDDVNNYLAKLKTNYNVIIERCIKTLENN